MASFDYNHQNPSSFLFCLLFLLSMFSLFFFLRSTGFAKFEFEKKKQMNSGRCSQMAPYESGLFKTSNVVSWCVFARKNSSYGGENVTSRIHV